MIIIYPFILALANRCRGGLIKVSSGQLGRLFWAIPFALVLFLIKSPDIIWQKFVYMGFLIAGCFGGAACVSWGKYDTEPNNWNPWKLTIQGIIFTGIPAIVISLISIKLAVIILLSGILIAPAYALGWEIPSKIKNFEQGIPLGEFFFGFLIGLFSLLYYLLTKSYDFGILSFSSR